MFNRMVVVLLILVALPIVYADDVFSQSQELSPAEQSRYLSAEAQRLIRTEFDEMEQSLKNYQDDNFRALDGEMKKTLTENTQTLVVGSLGAFLLGGAIITLILYRVNKKHSIERIDRQSEKADYENAQPEVSQGSFQQIQPEWDYQSDQHSWSQNYGQRQASDYSRYSTHQVQAPYSGGWEWNNGGNQQ